MAEGNVDGGGGEENQPSSIAEAMSGIMGNANNFGFTSPVSQIPAGLLGLFGYDYKGDKWGKHEDFSYGKYGVNPATANDVYGMPGTQNFGMGKYGMKAFSPGQIKGVSDYQAQKDKASNFMSHTDPDKQVGLKGLAANMAAATAGTGYNLGQALFGAGAEKFGYLGSAAKNMADIAAILGQTKSNMATILGNMGIYGGAGDPYGGGMGTMGLGGGGRAESHHF
jgi:hypothetical protein